jgi:hypothetical protein
LFFPIVTLLWYRLENEIETSALNRIRWKRQQRFALESAEYIGKQSWMSRRKKGRKKGYNA